MSGGDWNPGSGADWLLPPQWVFDEPVPDHPTAVPVGNGLPELVPYRYRGSDFSIPAAPAVTSGPPVRRKAREATLLDDPALRYAGLPFSAPAGWQQDRAWEEAS